MTTKYLTTEEVATVLRVDKEWVQRQCKAGALRAIKLGTEWRITEAAVVEFMAGAVPPARRRLTARQQRRAS